MRKTIIILLMTIASTLATTASALAMTSNNGWKAYMSYHTPEETARGGKMIYVLASGNLYTYNTADNEVRTYDKTNMLSDCGIAHIAWCAHVGRLVIVYNNQNIDLMDAEHDEVVNVPDFYLKTMTDDKTVNSIYISEHYAYLATAFGILKLNVKNAEISDTYNLQANVAYTYIEGNYLYAAERDRGLYRASMSSNMADPTNWQRVGDFSERSFGSDAETLEQIKDIHPDGPQYNNFAAMRFVQGGLYTVGGGYTVANDFYRPGCVQVLKDDEWHIYERNFADKTGGEYFLDINGIDVDPQDTSHVFACGRTGIFEFKSGRFLKHYSYDNSLLASTFSTDKGYVVVHDVKFDNEHRLWCLNSINLNQNILRMDPDGTWHSFHKEQLDGLTNLTNLLFDSRQLIWFVNNSWQNTGLFCYQPQTDAMNAYQSFVNQDGTSVNVEYVHCVAEDNENYIWIGTNVGPLRLSADQITASQPIFEQVKVPRNDGTNFADYLLDGVDVSCIAIDGAGRHWFGTNGMGIYLISADNMEQIAHFTATNSPLLSDNIESMVIDRTTGTIYIGTNKGLCSYNSGATEPVDEMNKDVTYAYPNPVRPGYTGPITITGLTYNADIKIVTASGTLVAQGRSNGGTFEWDGCDLHGHRVASGVYMVQTATADGSKGTVCKIAVVN